MAQGTSLGIVLLPVGLFGVVQYYKEGVADLRVMLIISVGFFVASFLGNKLTLSLPHDAMKKIFAILLLVVAIAMLFEKAQSKNSTQIHVKKDTPLK
jgi:uncharacterized membrane protein YfcA